MRLHDLIPGWGEDQPSTLVDLVNTDYDTLTVEARNLRAMSVDLVHSFERAPVLTARHAFELMERHHLPVRRGRWVFVALNSDKDRVYVRSERGMRLQHAVFRRVPSPDVLAERAPLPAGGAYVVTYGGPPDEVPDEDVERLEQLYGEHSIVDVLFLDMSSRPSRFMSARAGVMSDGSGSLHESTDRRFALWR